MATLIHSLSAISKPKKGHDRKIIAVNIGCRKSLKITKNPNSNLTDKIGWPTKVIPNANSAVGAAAPASSSRRRVGIFGYL